MPRVNIQQIAQPLPSRLGNLLQEVQLIHEDIMQQFSPTRNPVVKDDLCKPRLSWVRSQCSHDGVTNLVFTALGKPMSMVVANRRVIANKLHERDDADGQRPQESTTRYSHCQPSCHAELCPSHAPQENASDMLE